MKLACLLLLPLALACSEPGPTIHVERSAQDRGGTGSANDAEVRLLEGHALVLYVEAKDPDGKRIETGFDVISESPKAVSILHSTSANEIVVLGHRASTTTLRIKGATAEKVLSVVVNPQGQP
jgi:hypothetical protein